MCYIGNYETKINVRFLFWVFAAIGIPILIIILLTNASATTIYVDDSGGKDYTTIKGAINAASAGDTIYVYNGVYNENFLITKQITLVGESNQSTIVRGVGNPNDPGIAITSNYVSVSYLRIENFGCGIFASPVSNTNIIYTTITDSIIWGAYIEGDNNIVSGNTIINCKNSGTYSDPSIPKESYGISVTGNNNIFTSNVITNISSSKKSYGIYGRGSYNVFSYNKITDIKDSQGFNSEGMDLYGTGNVISYNIINNNDYSIGIVGSSTYNDVLQNTLTNSTYGAIIFGTYHTIKFNNLMNSSIMILQGENTVLDNTINNKPLLYYKNINATVSPQVLDNVYANGIILYNCSGVKIKNSSIDGGSIILDASSNIEIDSNNITSRWFGVLVFGGSNNTIISNTITNGGDGIYLRAGTENNIITHNVLTGHKHNGIKIEFGSNNSISMNNIYNNKEYGLYISEGRGTGNTAFNNWWGSASGPHNATSNPNGRGDNVSGIAQYSPWVTSYLNFSPSSASPKIITVDDSGGKDYTKIQDAINAAHPGDTVYIYNGTYREQITVYEDINIIGENNQSTIIEGNGAQNSSGIYIIEDSVNVSNINVDNFDIGIYIYYSSNDNVASNIITNSNEGIYVHSGSNNNIVSNIIADNSNVGISLLSASKNNIASNTLTNNSLGVSLLHSSNNTIETNIIEKTSGGYYENDTGLVGFWSMDEGSGTTVSDKSGNGNAGTLINGPTWVDGKYGKALLFDGADDYIDCGNNPSFDVVDLTLEAWIYPTSWVNGVAIITKRDSWSGTDWELFYNGVDQCIDMAFGQDNPVLRAYNTKPPLNQWSHLVYTKTGNNHVFYVNGIQTDSFTITVTVPTGDKIRIGKMGGDVDYVFNGIIDEVRIYNRALNQDEIKAHYAHYAPNAGISLSLTSNDNNIVSNTIMNGTNGISIYSSSDNNITSNIIMNNNKTGVSLSLASNNNITSNTITNNSDGVSISSSSNNNAIIDNIIAKNENNGIILQSSSGNNITLNNIHGNKQYGVYSDTSTGNSAYNNWWGDSSGPHNQTANPDGKGDNISGSIIDTSWVSSQINHPPVVATIGNKMAFVDTEFVLQINAIDRDENVLRYTDNTEIFEIDPTTGLIRFTPLNTKKGNYAITISVSDGIDTTNTIFNLSIPNRAPRIESIENQTAFVGSELTFYVNATDADNDILTYVDNSPLITIDSTTGLIKFTPLNTNKGNYAITISVGDGTDTTNTTFNLSVPNRTPRVEPIVNQTAFVGSELTFYVNAIDADNDTLTYASDSSLFYINTTTGLIKFTPLNTKKGNHTITISVNDGMDTTTGTLNLSIPNRSPVIATIVNQTVEVGVRFEYQINAIDPDNDTLIFTSNIGNITNTGIFSYISNITGLYNVRITANDTEQSTIRSFTLSIEVLNRPPIIVSPISQNATVGRLFFYRINATDADNDTLTYTDNTTFFIINQTTGTISFLPSISEIGRHNVTIFVSDGKNIVNTTFILNVNNASNIPPSLKITSEFNDIVSGTIKITGTSTDDFFVQHVQIRIDGGEWINATDNTSWSYYLDTTTLTNGEHRIDVRAYDGEFYSTEETLNIVVSNLKEERKENTMLRGNELLIFLVVGIIISSVILVTFYLRERKRHTTDAVVRQLPLSDVTQTSEITAHSYPEQYQQYAYPEGHQQTEQYPAPPHPEGYLPYPQDSLQQGYFTQIGEQPQYPQESYPGSKQMYVCPFCSKEVTYDEGSCPYCGNQYPEGYLPYPQEQYPPEQYPQNTSQEDFTQISEQPQYVQHGEGGEGQGSAPPQGSYPSSKQLYVCPFCGKEATYDEGTCPYCGNQIR
jgi:parallel beta-helix repeat protein